MNTFSLLKKMLTPNPSRDWYVVLGVGAGMGGLFVGVSLYFLMGIHFGFIVRPVPVVSQPFATVSYESIENLVEEYTIQIKNFEEKNFNSLNITDPSL